VRNSEPAYNFPHKALYVGGHNFGKRLYLYPLNEVIDYYNEKPPLADVNAPLDERPWRTDCLKVGGWLVNQGVVLLTTPALTYVLGTFLAGSRLVVPYSNDSSRQSPIAAMHSTIVAVKVIHDKFGMFLAYAFQ